MKRALQMVAILAVLFGPAVARSEASEDAPPVELSVPPMDHVTYPSDRPNWISETGDPDVIVVESEVQPSPEEAEDVLRVMVRAAVQTIIADRVDALRSDITARDIGVNVSDAWIDSQLVVRRYAGTVEAGGETRFESAVMLKLDADDNERLDKLVRNAMTSERLAALGVMALVGFAGLLGGSVVLNGLSSRQKR